MGSYRYLACAAGLVLAGFSLVSSGPSSGGLTTQFLNIPAVSVVARYATSHNDGLVSGPTNACEFPAFLPGIHGDLAEFQGHTTAMRGSYIAPVFLPQAATVTALSLFTRDNDATDLHAYLVRKKTQHGLGANSGYSVMANTQSSGAASGNMKQFTDSTVGGAMVDNSQYTYYVELVGCGIDLFAVSVRIAYTTP
jgi:hypothetical protein